MKKYIYILCFLLSALINAQAKPNEKSPAKAEKAQASEKQDTEQKNEDAEKPTKDKGGLFGTALFDFSEEEEEKQEESKPAPKKQNKAVEFEVISTVILSKEESLALISNNNKPVIIRPNEKLRLQGRDFQVTSISKAGVQLTDIKTSEVIVGK